MDDLIRRGDAIDAICKACSMEEDYHKCDGYPETSTWCDYLGALRALPSAERKGKWTCSDDLYETAICSRCKADTGEAFVNALRWFKYCPYCGAKMVRGEVDE